MNKQFFICTAIVFLSVHLAQAQVKFPASSPTQSVKQEFGLGYIELTYSRPGSMGRRVFGDMVPFGKLWVTGANAPTKLIFSDAVEIYGRRIEPGTYLLYTIPGEYNWEVIINKGIKNTATEGYRESEDVFRFKTDPIKSKTKTETFTIQFADIKPGSCELQLMWEKKLISIPISTNVKEKIRVQLEAAMRAEKKPFWAAAQYYNEYEINLNKAMENINKATEANPKAFWMFLYKAKIQKELGDYPGARLSAKTSLALSKEAKNDDYIKMNEVLLKELKRK